MRWTDVPVEAAYRTIDAWRDASGTTVCAAAQTTLGAGLAALAPGDGPVVILGASAFDVAWRHVAASPLERGGLLLGEPLLAAPGDAQPSAVFVRTAVAGLDDDATEYSLRLHAGVWDAARAELKPGEIVVGWFHSHPDIGAFFSATDRRTQAGFFSHPFSLGWVIDPVRREEAWFVGPGSREVSERAVLR